MNLAQKLNQHFDECGDVKDSKGIKVNFDNPLDENDSASNNGVIPTDACKTKDKKKKRVIAEFDGTYADGDYSVTDNDDDDDIIIDPEVLAIDKAFGYCDDKTSSKATNLSFLMDPALNQTKDTKLPQD